jgi:hypothetical protein
LLLLENRDTSHIFIPETEVNFPDLKRANWMAGAGGDRGKPEINETLDQSKS